MFHQQREAKYRPIFLTEESAFFPLYLLINGAMIRACLLLEYYYPWNASKLTFSLENYL